MKERQGTGCVIQLSNDLSVYNPVDKYFFKRDTSTQALNNLASELSNIDWNFIYSQTDANDAYNDFIHVLSSLFNKHCKFKKVNKSKQNLKSPWMTNSILKSVKTKHKLFKTYVKNPTDLNKAKFSVYRNKLTIVIRQAKKNHYQNIFDDNKNNLSKTGRQLMVL